MAQTKNSQNSSGSNSARTGKPREQNRRGTVVGAGSGSRGRSTPVATTAPARPTLPLAGAGGRRGRGNPINFIHDVRSELRKVAWPTQRETINLTVVVIALSVSVGIFLGGVDLVFQELFRWLLGLGGGGGI